MIMSESTIIKSSIWPPPATVDSCFVLLELVSIIFLMSYIYAVWCIPYIQSFG